MNKFMKALSYILAFSLGAFIMMGYIYYRLGGRASTGVSKLDQLETIIDERFIEDVDMTALEDAAADAMVTATGDRWSYYIPASQYASYVEQMQNAYVGIGVTIQPGEEPAGLEVVQVTAGGPAEAAGIQVFDVIVEAEGQNCSEIGMEETRSIIRARPVPRCS